MVVAVALVLTAAGTAEQQRRAYRSHAARQAAEAERARLAGLFRLAGEAGERDDLAAATRLLTEYAAATDDRAEADRLLEAIRQVTADEPAQQVWEAASREQYRLLQTGQPPAPATASTDWLRRAFAATVARNRAVGEARRDGKMYRRLNGQEDGDVYVADPSGRVRAAGRVSGGKREGVWLEDGKVGRYTAGQRTGVWSTSPSSQFAAQHYMSGNPVGRPTTVRFEGDNLTLEAEGDGWRLTVNPADGFVLVRVKDDGVTATGEPDDLGKVVVDRVAEQVRETDHMLRTADPAGNATVPLGRSGELVARIRTAVSAAAVAKYDKVAALAGKLEEALRREEERRRSETERRKSEVERERGELARERKAASDLALLRLDRFRTTFTVLTPQGRSYELAFNLLNHLNQLKTTGRLNRQAAFEAFAVAEASGMARNAPDYIVGIGGAWIPPGSNTTLRESLQEAVNLIPGR